MSNCWSTTTTDGAGGGGGMPVSEGAANSNGPSPDEELWNRPSHMHKNYQESKDQAEALTYFKPRREEKFRLSLHGESAHKKSWGRRQIFWGKGRPEGMEGAGALLN